MLLMRMAYSSPSLTKTSPLFTLFTKTPLLLSRIKPRLNCFPKQINKHYLHTNPFSMTKSINLSTSAAIFKDPYPSKSLPNPLSNKSKKKARKESPEGILQHKLGQCSKNNDISEAIRLYDEARLSGTRLNVNHYNVLLYLCSGLKIEEDVTQNDVNQALNKGFEIFKQMSFDNVTPNEATFTSAARLAAAKQDPEMAFELVKKMKSCGILPKLRSYGPALFGFVELGLADKAYEVDTHMVGSGVMAEEMEVTALLKVSSEGKRVDKVYEMMHRLRSTVRQVSEETVKVIEDWFNSESSEKVGFEKWDMEKVKKGVVKGGGGWHGVGWLGKGKWKVVKTEMNEKGVCNSCGEKLVCIDIDPKETENFALSIAKLASKKEVKADFVRFQEWLEHHGPFDAIVDGANVSLVNQHYFNFAQLKSIVNQLQEQSPSKRLPLVILHKSRVTGGPAQNPNNKKLLESWKKAGTLYATPQGSNDDWYWLYAAVKCKSLLVTNDEMRDHLFQLLGTSFFPRWKEKHQVRLAFSRKGISLKMPPPYSSVIQESEEGSWHVPTVIGDDIDTPRQWVCATRSKANNLSSLFV